jgi:putative colanic acid biosysnthesis UDP-glucose lipid carrier transferase
MRTRITIIYLLYLFVDWVALFFALLLSAVYSLSPYIIQHSKYTIADLDLQYIYFLLCFVWYFSARSSGIYNDSRPKLYSIEAYNIVKNILFQIICLILILFVVKEKALTRTFILVYFVLVTVFIFTGKIFVRFILNLFRERIAHTNRVVIVGANELGENVH